MSKETLAFDADVDKIFHLMINAIYENKEIFLRELISNASDACDKLRYKSITKPDLIKDDPEFKITIRPDTEKGTLTITDNGIGMSRTDMIKNLGTIARSGTQGFLKNLTGEDKKDSHLIGQFGVGFYSSLMVAEKIEVVSQAAGGKKAHKWTTTGNKEFDIEELKESPGRGTSVTVYLREEEKEYLDKHRIKHVIETYSNHIAFNISFIDEDGNEERINDGKAIWTKNKSDITEDEYKEFYHNVSHLHGDTPWLTLHNKAEGVIEYTNLLYIPSTKPFDLYNPDRQTQVKLYVKRVFIAEEGIDIIPSYMRFLRGVVDSEDLPLNISRETVQNNVVVQKISSAITKRVLSELAKKAEKEPEEFKIFWDNFGPVLKEGLCDGMSPRDDIIEACRFYTTKSEGKLTSLKEYVERMKSDQETIYYITGDDEKKILASPQLEGFKDKGIEVLLLTDNVDQFWVSVLYDYQGIALQSVTRSSADLDEATSSKSTDDDKDDNKRTKADKDNEKTIAYFKKVLGEHVEDVKTTSRLKESPVCLTVPDGAMDIRMERFMVDNKQLQATTAKILEINPDHPIIQRLAKDIAGGPKKADEDTVHLLFDQANIVEGEPIQDIIGFTKRFNKLLAKSLAA